MKNFFNWIKLKEKLHSNSYRPPLVKERDIWWISVGENIGSEINGKSSLFSRPVIILKKLAHGFYFVVRTSTQVKEGSWYVKFLHNKRQKVACLHQVRVVDYRRLSNKLGTIDTNDFYNIQIGLRDLYLKNIPCSKEQGRG